MTKLRTTRGAARLRALAGILAGALALGMAGCADPALSSKSVGDEPTETEQSLERNAKAPRLEAQLSSQFVLERYAYTTAKGNIACPTDLWADRPPFTVEDGPLYEFCLEVGDTKTGAASNAKVDVTYKITGDAQGRTVWFKADVPYRGVDTIACEVRKADMKTADTGAPYTCRTDWLDGKSTDFPRASFELTAK